GDFVSAPCIGLGLGKATRDRTSGCAQAAILWCDCRASDRHFFLIESILVHGAFRGIGSRSVSWLRQSAHDSPGRALPAGALRQSMIPKKPALGLDPRGDTGFPPARSPWHILSCGRCFGGRGRSEKDHAPAKSRAFLKLVHRHLSNSNSRAAELPH